MPDPTRSAIEVAPACFYCKKPFEPSGFPGCECERAAWDACDRLIAERDALGAQVARLEARVAELQGAIDAATPMRLRELEEIGRVLSDAHNVLCGTDGTEREAKAIARLRALGEKKLEGP